MGWVFGIILLVPALYGIYCLGVFAITRAMGTRHEGELIGYTKTRSRGRRCPVVIIEDASLQKIKTKVVSIDNIAYLLHPADRGAVLPLLSMGGNGLAWLGWLRIKPGVRLYGYRDAIIGAVCVLPIFIWYLVSFVDPALLVAWVFLFIILIAVCGGWLLLRWIRFHY